MWGKELADQLVLIAPEEGTVMMDKGDIMKTIYEHMLRIDGIAGSRRVSLKLSVVPVDGSI